MGFRWSIDLPRYILFGIWMFINLALIAIQLGLFEGGRQYFYMRVRTMQALSFARGPALMINFNTALVLLPICRNLISFIRGCCSCAPRGIRALLDKNLTFHQWFAWAIVVGSAIHTGAHWYNYERFVANAGSNMSPEEANPPGIGPTNPSDPVLVCFSTAAGITGHVMVVVLFLMVTSSIEFIRRSYFEVFWYTHHLFVIYLIALGFHQTQRLLPVQNNFNVHPPERCSMEGVTGIPESAPDSPCSTDNPPTFTASGPTSFFWFVVPLFIYIIERAIRLVSYCMPVVVTKVVEHPSKVYEIQMKRRWFHPEVGQYIFINVPSASVLEWHPFTMTSAPEEDSFSVHIRIVGDWTAKVARKIGIGSSDFKQSWQLPKIFVDGPFGTASEDVFNFEVAMLCGAGIGITPFASVLKSVWYKLQDRSRSLKLKKVYFFWIAPDTSSFEWFQDLLQTLEADMISQGWGDFLEYHIYLTRGWSDKDAKVIMMHDTEDGGDAITGLQQKTHFGRPQWENIFDQVSLAHPGTDVGVLFCGPKVLSHTLHKNCNLFNKRATTERARFFYNKENF